MGRGRTPEGTRGGGWESARPRTPHTKARGAAPGHPHAAPGARKSARCGVGDGSPHRHPPHPQPRVVGPGRLMDERSKVGERPSPYAPQPGKRRPPPGILMPPPQHARARAVGLVTGLHAHRPPHPQPVGSGPRPHAPTDERSGVGERPSPYAPQPGKRRPPRAPSCRPHSTQEHALWAW